MYFFLFSSIDVALALFVVVVVFIVDADHIIFIFDQ